MTPQGDDEIVAEVRRARERFFQDSGGTLEGLYARLKELEKTDARQMVSPGPRPAAVPQPAAG
jgi:hypothetical protein